jgi:hypothetical protein
VPLSFGDKLGPYEILSAIGSGGMGEVYKARDTRLDRTVAVKVLPEHIAQREDLSARFEREASAVASLNQPNICTLRDIGPGYMVMELIEGETLADRIEKGALATIPAQQFCTAEREALGESLSFSPAHALPEHAPLGGINRARSAIYQQLSSTGYPLDSPNRLGSGPVGRSPGRSPWTAAGRPVPPPEAEAGASARAKAPAHQALPAAPR